jgi:hypothetical protein
MLPAIKSSQGRSPLAARQLRELRERSSTSLDHHGGGGSRVTQGMPAMSQHVAVRGGGMTRSYSVDLGMFELAANRDMGQTWNVVDQLCNLETFVQGALSYNDAGLARGRHGDTRPQRRSKAIRSIDNARGSPSPSSPRQASSPSLPRQDAGSMTLSPVMKPAVRNRKEDAFAKKIPGGVFEMRELRV